jgi:hypothetical protein
MLIRSWIRSVSCSTIWRLNIEILSYRLSNQVFVADSHIQGPNWYHECVDMYRRIIFIGVLPLFSMVWCIQIISFLEKHPADELLLFRYRRFRGRHVWDVSWASSSRSFQLYTIVNTSLTNRTLRAFWAQSPNIKFCASS